MSGKDNEGDGPPGEPDRVEIWARRTGRTLGYVVLLVLILYLLFTYAR
ncbi:MAG: hypothetical protein KDJ88_01040 [Bauldia sp.]|nr:hypothetical protein [Bauldia sp.]